MKKKLRRERYFKAEEPKLKKEIIEKVIKEEVKKDKKKKSDK